MCLTSLATIF